MEFFSMPETTETSTPATESDITMNEVTTPEITITETTIIDEQSLPETTAEDSILPTETATFSIIDTPTAITETSIDSTENEIAESPIEALELNQTTPTETSTKNHEPLSERISAFLKELQELKQNDEAAKVKLEEELKQIQEDEKKINDTITLLNKIKNV